MINKYLLFFITLIFLTACTKKEIVPYEATLNEVNLKFEINKFKNSKGFFKGNLVITNTSTKKIEFNYSNIRLIDNEKTLQVYLDTPASVFPILELKPDEKKIINIYLSQKGPKDKDYVLPVRFVIIQKELTGTFNYD